MIAPALIAVIVVHAGAMSPATATRRAPGTVLARSDPSTTAGRRLRLLVRIDSHAAIKGIPIADLIENVREIWRPHAEIDFADIGGEAAAYDDELRLVITDSPPAGLGSRCRAWLDRVSRRPPAEHHYRLCGSGADADESRHMAGPHHRRPAAVSATAVRDTRAQPELGARDRSLPAAIQRARAARPDAGTDDRRGDHGRHAGAVPVAAERDRVARSAAGWCAGRSAGFRSS